MANANPIVVSMKLLANVTDAKKLTEYIHTLGQELKRAGGSDANALRNKLLEIRKALSASGGSKEAVKGFAKQVSAMMPDISKSKSLGSLDAIEGKLKSFGTAQAKAIIGTVGKIRAAFQSGNLSQNTVDLLSTSLEKFVEQAKKLPPPQMAKLGKDMRGLIANTQELKDVVEEVNGIDWKIDLKGGSFGELTQKISIAEAAQSLHDDLDGMIDHIEDFGESGADAVNELKANFDKVLNGNLGKGSVKALKEVEQQALKMASSLSGKQLQKAGPVLQGIIARSRQLQEELKRTGNAAVDSFDAVDAVTSQAGIHAGEVEKTVVAIASKIPKIGAAIAALPIGWVFAVVGAIVALVKSTWDYFKGIRDTVREITLDNIDSMMESINDRLEVQAHLDDLVLKKEKEKIAALKAERETVDALKRSQMELAKSDEMRFARTTEQKNAIDQKYAARQDAQAISEKRNDLKERRLEKNAEIEDNAKAIAREKERVTDLHAVAREASLERQSLSTLDLDPQEEIEQMNALQEREKKAQDEIRKAKITINNLEAERERLTREAANVNDKRLDEAIDKEEKMLAMRREAAKIEEDIRLAGIRAQRERTEELRGRERYEEARAYEIETTERGQGADIKLTHQREELARWRERENRFQYERDNFLVEWRRRNPTATEFNDEEQRKFDNITQDLDEARQKRISAQSQVGDIELQLRQSAHARTREQEVYEYDRDKQERDYQRGKRQPWQNLDQQLVEAEKELVRYANEENEALEIREGILKRLRDEKRTEMTQEESTLFSEATSDLTRSRSSRYSEQQNIDSLKKQIHDRQFEKEMSDYGERREDADWERQGAYQRGNWSQKLKMDIDRYREGKRMFDEAEAKIRADNEGTLTLSPEERRIAERDRAEGREKMTSTRDSIRSAAMEGDQQRMSFVASLFGHRNRLTAMGLGGDVANWDRQTASNTRKLVEQNKEVIKALQRDFGGSVGWGY